MMLQYFEHELYGRKPLASFVPRLLDIVVEAEGGRLELEEKDPIGSRTRASLLIVP
jgi:hypothetical protein